MENLQQLSARLWDDIVKLQRKQRMTATVRGSAPESAGATLSFGEGLALHLLSAQKESNVRDLALALGLERSWVSRIITGLEERGTIESKADAIDRRQKIIGVTRQGYSVLKKLNKERRDLFSEMLSSLSEDEQSELADLINSLATAFGVPVLDPTLDPHPVDLALARLSCAIGVAGNSFMGTGVNVTQYHVMMLLAEAHEHVTVSDLHQRMPIDMSSLSRTVESFVKKKLVKKSKSNTDGRSFLVSLSAKGEKYFVDIREKACSKMLEAVAALDRKLMDRLVTLIEYAAKDIPNRDVQYSKPKLQLTLVHENQREDIAEAKKALKMVGSDRGAVTLYSVQDEGQTVGAIQLVIGEDKGQLAQVNFSVSNMAAKDCVELLKNAFKSL
ncbi:MAG: MarR family transcriptional regulator [Bdellovibrionales bacterium]|nr:MarR family transcriptional regulator [Bdellovibrionales bacterium]